MAGTSCTTPQRMKCLHADSSPANLTTGRLRRCYVSSVRTGRRMHGLRQHGSRSWKHPNHPRTSPRIGPRRRHRWRRSESKHWTTLNRLRTRVGRYRASMKKWGLTDSAACECGEPQQTADDIINSCPLYIPPSEAGLFQVGPLTRAWLQLTELIL